MTRRRLAWSAVTVVIAVATAAVLSASGYPADRYRHNDFMGFWAGSRALLDGIDPYDPAAWVALHERVGSHGLSIVPPRTGYGYPLVTAVVFLPFALLPVEVAAPLWLVAQAVVALAATIALASVLFRATLRRDLPLLLALGGTSQPAWVLAEGGNIGGFLLAAAAGATSLLVAGRPFAAGVVAGLLVVKPHLFAIAIPLVLLSLPRTAALRMLAGGGLTALALLAVSLAVRPGWVAEWLVPVERLHAAPVSRADVFGLFPPGAQALAWIAAAFLVAGALLWLRRGRSPAVVVGVALPISLFTAPYAWSYDDLVMLVSVSVVLASIAPLPTRDRTPVLAFLVLVVVALPWVLYALAFRQGDEAWSAVVPLTILAALFMALREKRRSPAPRRAAAPTATS